MRAEATFTAGGTFSLVFATVESLSYAELLNVCKHVRKGDKCRVPPVQPVISHLSCSETPSNCGLPNGCTSNEHVYHHFHFCVACSFPDENACRSFVVVATDYSLHWSHFDCCQFAHT